jgi:hypothetical protein
MKGQHSEVFRPRRTLFRFPFWPVPVAVTLFAAAALAQNGDVYVYPAQGQNQAQQSRDRYECHSWAVQQTGFDPSRPQQASLPSTPPPNMSGRTAYQPPQGHMVRGAARGAALGAVGGAITGDAGKGAAAGAAMGGVAGVFRRRDARRQQAAQQQAAQQQYAQQQAAQHQAAQQGQQTAYYRAMAACLQGRGYTVN